METGGSNKFPVVMMLTSSGSMLATLSLDVYPVQTPRSSAESASADFFLPALLEGAAGRPRAARSGHSDVIIALYSRFTPPTGSELS
jgi:hypothetical protein